MESRTLSNDTPWLPGAVPGAGAPPPPPAGANMVAPPPPPGANLVGPPPPPGANLVGPPLPGDRRASAELLARIPSRPDELLNQRMRKSSHTHSGWV